MIKWIESVADNWMFMICKNRLEQMRLDSDVTYREMKELEDQMKELWPEKFEEKPK